MVEGLRNMFGARDVIGGGRETKEQVGREMGYGLRGYETVCDCVRGAKGVRDRVGRERDKVGEGLLRTWLERAGTLIIV